MGNSRQRHDINLSTFAVDAPYIYFAGIDYFTSWEWRIEKRNLGDGSFVTSFGTAGAVTSFPSSQEELNALAVSGNYLCAGGYGVVPTNIYERRIEKRYK